LAWHRQQLDVRSPLGALWGHVGEMRKQAREERAANPDEWVHECYIEDLGEVTEEGVRRRIWEMNR